MHRLILEMKRGGLKDLASQLLPILSLREDGMTHSAGVVTTLLGIANFEDQFHFLFASIRVHSRLVSS